MPGLAYAVRALRSRNYRLFFGGQSVSLIGTWMTRVAMSWLVYRLTGSAALLGLVGFAGQIPTFFLAPLAGVWVDRWNRRRTLVATQALSMAQSLALAGLALAGVVTTGEILFLALAQGVINAFDMPARQVFVLEMVDRREDLGNAIALNSSMVNAARLIGPAIAGVVIAAAGEGYCFLADGLSYIAVIVSLAAMRTGPTAPHWLWLSLAVLAAAGFGMMQQMASSNTILQTIVEDEKRGRVMSFYAMAFQGMTPFGSLMAGGLASWMGAPATVALGGALTVAGATWFARKLPAVRAQVRPIYAQLGILPEN